MKQKHTIECPHCHKDILVSVSGYKEPKTQADVWQEKHPIMFHVLTIGAVVVMVLVLLLAVFGVI